MAIYRDADGRWRFRIVALNRFTGEKRRLSGTPTINTQAAAKIAERDAVMAYESPPAGAPDVVVESITFADLAEEYRDRYLARARAGTRRKNWANVENHLIPALGELALNEITPQALESLATNLQNSPRLPRGAEKRKIARGLEVEIRQMRSPRTVHAIFDTLHKMLVLAREWGHMPKLPTFPKLPKLDERRSPAYLTYEEEARLYAAATLEERLLIKFAIRTGLRAGEQLSLVWSSVDLDRRLVHVRWSFSDAEKVLTPTKGGRERWVPFDAELASELAPLAAQAASHANSSQRLVFSNASGGRLTLQNLRVILNRVARKAGIAKHVHWHMLRHTFGTHAAMGGVPLVTLKEWMGHSSINQTEKYAHAAASMNSAFVDRAAAARQAALQQMEGGAP